MKPCPTVSVLMTAFNREEYVGPAIESVLAQTFTDFELIVVDDCSTDGTVEAVRPYLADPRVRLVQNERNLGDYPNRNHAASCAAGEFIKYHDSDDLMYPHCLAVLVGLLRDEPSAAFAISAQRSWPGGPSPMLLTPRLAYEREFFGLGLVNFGPASALFRRDMFDALGRFPEAGPHSDMQFWLKACARVNTLLAYGDLFWYREHQGQHLRRADAGYDGARIEWKWFEALDAPECPLPPADRERAKRNAARRILRVAFRDAKRWRWHLVWFRLQHARLSLRQWIRYAGRPHASAEAGTPRTPNGQLVIAAALRRRSQATGGKP